MSLYVINVTNGANTGTVIPDVGFEYTDLLNDINELTIKISGSGSNTKTLFAMGSLVEVKRDGTRDFYGLVDMIDYLDGGGLKVHVSGYEVRLTKEGGTYSSSPYLASASATIFGDIISESNYFTAGTVEAGTNIDFRIKTNEKQWSALSNLSRKTTQDIQIDYINLEIDILDHRGNASSVITLNDGISIRDMRVTEAYPTGNTIKVYGKGDGEEQITATAIDATSVSTYGTIVKEVYDPTIISEDEADKLADAELAIYKDPTKVYDFDVINTNQSFIAGDVITLNSHSKGVSGEQVRIVGIIRGINGDKEFLSLQVTNESYSTLIAKRNRLRASQEKINRDNNAYMQGSGNLSQWTEAMNANSSYASVVNFTIGSDYFADEAGNLRVSTLKFDYDVDKFREGYGKGTYDGDDVPLISSDSGDNYDLTVTDEDDDDISLWEVHAWEEIKEWTAFAVHGDMIVFHVQLNCLDSDDLTQTFSLYARVKNKDTGDYYPSSEGVRVTRGKIRWESEDASPDTDSDTHTHTMGTDTHSHGYNVGTYDEVRVYNSSDDWGYVGSTETDTHDHTNSNDTHDHQVDAHSHDIDLFLDGCVTIIAYADPFGDDWAIEIKLTGLAIGDDARGGAHVAYSVESRHKHNEGGYETDGDLFDKFTIGDDVGESSSTNATSIDIHLDHWNGSSWDLDKHTIINTGSTLEIGVDISDSGTYPDATGLWRVRTFTNKSSPDLVISRVSVKHEIDN